MMNAFHIFNCALIGAMSFADIAGKGRLEVPENEPCCVTGVVTYAAAWLNNSGIVADVDDPNGFGVWVSGDVNGVTVASLEGAQKLVVGQHVEITGTTSRLGFAPGVKAERIRVFGQCDAALPAPQEYRLRDFDWGVLDNRRAAIRGVLMDAQTNSVPGHASLQLATPDGSFMAHVPGDAAEWRRQIDAEIVVSGIAMSIFNIRGEFIGVQMDSISLDDVRIVREAIPAALVPEVPLADILPYAGRVQDAHRRRVRGTVTYAKSGVGVYLQSEAGALRVRTAATGLKVGFPRIESRMGLLAFAEVRKIGEGQRLQPIEIHERQLLAYPIKEDGQYENLDARLVRLEGRLLAVDARNIVIGVHDVRIAVTLDEPLSDEILAAADINPTLRLTGVLSMLQNTALPDGHVPSIAGWRLEVAGPDDVEIVRDENWKAFSRRRMVRGFAWCALGAVALLALVFVWRYLRFRTEYRRMDIISNERKRMAADLHDTIEQNLLAAKLMLQTSLSLSPDTPQNVKDAVGAAQEILMSAKAEIRETIFNLRSDELFARRSDEVLKSVAKRISALGVAKVRTSLRGLPPTLPGVMFADIVAIIKESATNAVKHGKAKNIMIVSDPAGERAFTLRIANDGEKFDPAGAPGLAEGHFGITGMRERARRNAIGFSIGVEKGLMTIRLEVKV